MKKIEINRKLYNVVTPEEYYSHPDMYSAKVTALEVGDYVLPVGTASDNTPGVYSTGTKLATVVKPSPETSYMYSKSRMIDLEHNDGIRDVMNKYSQIRSIQQELMVSGKENIFHATIGPDDMPEMRALKTAINNKQIDKKQYEDRFDGKYQNNIRLLSCPSITLKKMIEMCDGFDIACILTLQDKEGAPNPMGDPIVLDLTEGRPSKDGSTAND